MIKIAICDDEELAIATLNSLIIDILKTKKEKYSITSFNSGIELLNDPHTFDVIFLDIEMPELDGISVGKQLSEKNQTTRIVMATAAAERYKEAFKIHAFRFITKPFDRNEIKEALDSIIDLVNDEKYIEMYYQRVLYKVPYKNIQYISAINGCSEAYVSGRIFRRECSLSDMEELLDSNCFARISRFCIVNMNYIDSYQTGTITIDNKKMSVSKRRKKTFEQAYIKFDIDYR